MNNVLLIASTGASLIPIVFFFVNRKYFYYSALLLYPIIGQLIGIGIDLPFGTINPSMVFGFILLLLVSVDLVTRRIKNRSLFILVLVFLLYSFMISMISSVKMMSLVWTIKLALWMLTFIAAAEGFNEEAEVQEISRLVVFTSILVLCSLLLSFLGFLGDSKVYETGVKSYGAGFSSGKAIAYYFAFAVPILFGRIKIDKKKSLINYIVFFLVLMGIVVTFVRAPVVGIFIGLLSFYGFSAVYKDKSMLGTLFLVCFIGMVVVAVFIIFKDSPYLSRWYDLGNRAEQGQVEKLGSGRVGFLMAFFQYYVYKASISAKLFGTGLGSSLEALGTQRIIHNDFAEILMGLGLIGLTMYLLILLNIFKTFLNIVRNTSSEIIKEYSILGLSYFMLFLSFHMTNVTSGVFFLFIWALFSGAIVGAARHRANI